MDSPWLEDKIRELMSNLDKGQLEKLWKLRGLTSLDEDQVQELQRLHDDHQLRGIIEIAKKAPSNINLLISDKLDKAPVTDYVTEFEIRRHIFQRIKNIAIESPSGKINSALFAVFMVAPVHILESRLAELEDSHRRKNQTEIDEKLARWQSTTLNGIQAFVNKGGHQKGGPTAASSVSNSGRGSPSLPVNTDPGVSMPPDYVRSSDAVKLCKRRDNRTCCFTGMSDPDAAYIFPFDISENRTISNITDMLEMFWDADTATRLSALIRDCRITESPQNLISINRQLCAWFDNCKMALKPLGETEEGVIVQFHWLNESKYKPDAIGATTDSLENLMNKTGIRHGQSWGYIHAHRKSGLQLQTGQTFTLKSKNPAHMPSLKLLELSWDLLRIAAICGASGEFSDLSDDEDEDDCYSDVEDFE